VVVVVVVVVLESEKGEVESWVNGRAFKGRAGGGDC
jgi:hypothetical protein